MSGENLGNLLSGWKEGSGNIINKGILGTIVGRR